MKKKLVSVLMCMAMGATLLAGCGSEEAADSSNTTAADAADAPLPGSGMAVVPHLGVMAERFKMSHALHRRKTNLK